jgi:hypothetical protein
MLKPLTIIKRKDTAMTTTQPASPNTIASRVRRIHTQMLDVIEGMLAQMAEPPPAQAPVVVLRRQFANTLHIWRCCARSTCRRSGCCRGEPKHCLQYVMPLLPPETLARLAGSRKRGRLAQ